MINNQYIFSLEVCKDNNYKNIGFFNKIDGLVRTIEDEDKIQLLEGFIANPFLKIKKIKDCDIIINMYDSKFNLMTTFESGMIEKVEILYTNNLYKIILVGESLPFISSQIMKLWLERRKGLPIKKGSWIKLPRNQRQDWLEVSVLDYRFKYNKNIVKVEIDGMIIDDFDSFYCALGEAVYGVGGYIGRCYHSLKDCLTGGCGGYLALPLIVKWINSDYSQKVWVSNKEHSKYTDIIEDLEDLKEYITLELK